MLFYGSSEHSIDPKLRLAIPARYRNQWNPQADGAAWICVPWPTGLLRLYTETSFNRLAGQGEMTLTPDPDTAELQTTLFGLSERLEMDSAGRITIPRQHMELTGLGNDVIVTSGPDRIEVRRKDEWTKALQDRFKNLPDLARRVEEKRRVTNPSFPFVPPAHPPRSG